MLSVICSRDKFCPRAKLTHLHHKNNSCYQWCNQRLFHLPTKKPNKCRDYRQLEMPRIVLGNQRAEINLQLHWRTSFNSASALTHASLNDMSRKFDCSLYPEQQTDRRDQIKVHWMVVTGRCNKTELWANFTCYLPPTVTCKYFHYLNNWLPPTFWYLTKALWRSSWKLWAAKGNFPGLIETYLCWHNSQLTSELVLRKANKKLNAGPEKWQEGSSQQLKWNDQIK